MLINWKDYEDKEHVLSWFLTEAMSEAGIKKFGEFDSSKLDVRLTVNGIEVPIIKPMEYLNEQLNAIEEHGIKIGMEDAKIHIQNNISWILDLESEN